MDVHTHRVLKDEIFFSQGKSSCWILQYFHHIYLEKEGVDTMKPVRWEVHLQDTFDHVPHYVDRNHKLLHRLLSYLVVCYNKDEVCTVLDDDGGDEFFLVILHNGVHLLRLFFEKVLHYQLRHPQT